MKFVNKLMLFMLVLVNGMTFVSADVIVDGQVIESADISSIAIDPVSGNISVAAGGLYTVTKDGDPPPGPQVVINSLTTSSSSITEGQSVVISWTTTDATACTPSGGSGGWSGKTIALPSGNSGSMTLATPGTYVFTLSCTNATPTSATRNVTVVVNPDDPDPTSCPTPTLAGSTVSWSSHFGLNWPDPNYAEIITGITRRGYLAIEFDTGNILEDGGIATITHTSTNGERLGAISKCPGIFTADQLPDTVSRCTKQWFIGGSITWNTLAGNQSGQCNLEANTKYYLNLTFTDGVDPTTDRCSSSSTCRTILRVWK